MDGLKQRADAYCMFGTPCDWFRTQRNYRVFEIRAHVGGDNHLVECVKPLMTELEELEKQLESWRDYEAQLRRAATVTVTREKGCYIGGSDLPPDVWNAFTYQLEGEPAITNYSTWVEHESHSLRSCIIEKDCRSHVLHDDFIEYLSTWLGDADSSATDNSKSEGSGMYLHACLGHNTDLSTSSVFYFVDNPLIGQSLQELFQKEYGSDGSNTKFYTSHASKLSDADRILLDEACDIVSVYSEPDPGVYDPPPTRSMHRRSQYAVRARTWEAMLNAKKATSGHKDVGHSTRNGVESEGRDNTTTPHHESQQPSTDANATNNEAGVRDAIQQMAGIWEKLRLAATALIGASETTSAAPTLEIQKYQDALSQGNVSLDGSGEFSLVGQHLPPHLKEHCQSSLLDLQHKMEPLTTRHNAYPLCKDITKTAREALAGCMALEIALALIVTKPGESQIPKEEWRIAGHTALMILAQAYYKILESAISGAMCTSLDLELNQSYLWTTNNISALLQDHEDLKDFPTTFTPIFRDLYPSTIRDCDWEDMVAPEAEAFLSTVQQYVLGKGVYELTEGSAGGTFVRIFQSSAQTAMEHAEAYRKRMQTTFQRVLDRAAQQQLAVPASGHDERRSDSQHEIETLASTTPALNTSNGQWISNKVAAKLDGVTPASLTDYRKPSKNGIRDANKMLGCDCHGRIWRRAGTPQAHVWYLRSTLVTNRQINRGKTGDS